MNLNEKSRIAIPAYTVAGLLLSWLLYLTAQVGAIKTDVAVIRAVVSAAHGTDSSLAKSSK